LHSTGGGARGAEKLQKNLMGVWHGVQQAGHTRGGLFQAPVPVLIVDLGVEGWIIIRMMVI